MLPFTNYGNVYAESQGLIQPFAKTLTTAAAANAAFWPTIANFGLPYYLLCLEKVTDAQAKVFATDFGSVWTSAIDAAQKAGLLYAIDMSILDSLEPFTAPDGTTRFTPGSITLLTQDKTSKALTPAAVLLSTPNAGGPFAYGSNDAAWLYALQAAKTSITVWGIWVGHVYHLHVVTAAMQAAMYNTLPSGHPLLALLEPQSQSLIDFDFVLLTTLFNKISPPTPLSGPLALVKLLDKFAEGREFFDDDPANELAKFGLEKANFSKSKEWDQYPLAGWLLDLWKITHEYVDAVVKAIYPTENDLKKDTTTLNAWMDAAGDPARWNIRGLPNIKTRDDLTKVLTSMLYRVNAHGGGTLTPSVYPGLGFVANFPPCLQKAEIPAPGSPVTDLLERLPHTGTCGGMTTFFFTFVYSAPEVPLIPPTGITTDPYFPPSLPAANAALFKFRQDIHDFVDTYVADWNAAIAWFTGTNPPGKPPSYADNQYEQWSASIEL
jgi:hypothetical protein